MSRRTPTLIHRGYLYAQKHVRASAKFPIGVASPSAEVRMMIARGWREGYLSAQRDHAKRKTDKTR